MPRSSTINLKEAQAEGRGHRSCAHSLHDLLVHGIDPLFRFILVRVNGRVSLAEDILQQTACVALEHAVPPDEHELQAWLFGIARNLIRQHWRETSKQFQAAAHLQEFGQSLCDKMQQGLQPDLSLVREEEIRALAYAISSLDGEDQQIVYDHYRNELSLAEIARTRDTTAKSIESKLYRIRTKLRTILKDLLATDE